MMSQNFDMRIELTAITSNQTRSKFYVACTRAKHSVAFAVSNPKESKVFRSVEIKVGDIIIPAFKFVTG